MKKSHMIDKEKVRSKIRWWQSLLGVLLATEIVLLIFGSQAAEQWPVVREIRSGAAEVGSLITASGPFGAWLGTFTASPAAIFLGTVLKWAIPLLFAVTIVLKHWAREVTAEKLEDLPSGLLEKYAAQTNAYHDQVKAQCEDAFPDEPGVRVQIISKNRDEVVPWDEHDQIRIRDVGIAEIRLVLHGNRASVVSDYGLIPLRRNIPVAIERDSHGNVVLVGCVVTWLGGAL